MKRKINRYKIHRLAGLIFLPLLFISAITGFFRANYKWFWKEDYKKYKNESYEYKLRTPGISIDSVFIILKKEVSENSSISEIKLKSEAGKLFYDVKIKNHSPVLINAEDGEIKSPLSDELAATIAGQYVKSGVKLKNIRLDDNYLTRKDKKLRPVYIAEYDDPLHTKILIDKYNGEIEEEIDDNLKIGFLMVKLHDYDFWKAKRFNLSFVGLGIFFVGCTGLYLWIKKKKKRAIKSKTYVTEKAPI